jgi:hypothetical protein
VKEALGVKEAPPLTKLPELGVKEALGGKEAPPLTNLPQLGVETSPAPPPSIRISRLARAERMR